MKELKKEEIVKQYIESGKIIYDSVLNGDYKTGNKEGPKIIKIFKYLEKNIELANDTLPILFENENVQIRTEVAAHCLALGIHISEAEKILNDIANDGKNGIFRLNAEMTLKVWKEGKLTIYKKNK